MSNEITLFYQACDPSEPLYPHDPRYVPCDGVRGTKDLVNRVAKIIRMGKGPTHLLFSGHRGGGKSTELLRLKNKIEHMEDGRKLFVVYFMADAEDIDVNDVDFPDLLLAMVRQVGKALREAGKELSPHRLARVFDDIRQFLGSEVTIDNLVLDLKFAKVTATVKNSPAARDAIRKAVEPNVSNLIQAANDLIDEARLWLRQQGYDDLAIIVDNLDRIVLRDLPDSPFNLQERLFVKRGAQLTQIGCHVIYTVPISLLFSPAAPTLRSIYKELPYTLPMVKVIERDKQDNSDGIEAMREIARKRLLSAGVEAGSAFDSLDTLDYFCRMSGGHVRTFMQLIRSACTYVEMFPITRAVAEAAVEEIETGYDRALNKPDFFVELHKVDETQRMPGSDDDQMLLYNLSVLEYMNGKSIFAVNPIVRELSKFLTLPPSDPKAD